MLAGVIIVNEQVLLGIEIFIIYFEPIFMIAMLLKY